MANGILTPCNVARLWHWFRQVMHPAMWHVALESWQWIQPVAAAPAMWQKAQFQLTKLLSLPENRVFAFWRQHPMSAILDSRGPVMGSLKSPCTTSYRSSIETIALNCLVFEKIAFFAFWRQTDKLTDKHVDSTDAPSRCRYRERRLNKQNRHLDITLNELPLL